ncbi:MAG: PQQ-dependent sugar dehydrogenase [Dehalococcoidia bacterium]
MHRIPQFALVALGLTLLFLGAEERPAAADPVPDAYALTSFISGPEFDQPVDLAVIPGQEDEAIVAIQKDALLWRVSLTGAFAPVEFGDLTGVVGGGGDEEGLLSVTFSPQFESDGRIYVYYTQGLPQPNILSRFDATATDLDEGTEQVILQTPHPHINHNGGRLLFGPDGYLYLSLGDGGGGGDPEETGQDNTDLLGSVLRIDVTGETTYAIPPDNPYVGVAGADEVWAYGLRNPWRYSFDRMTGDLWLGDVGQGDWEEVQEIVKGGNYGWDCYEGFAAYEPAGCSTDPGDFEFPRAVYDHSLGCAVTGGYVYRGADLPDLYGWYVYADFCSGRIWAVNPADSSSPVQLLNSPWAISSFAELPDGELLALTFNTVIFRLTCDPALDIDSDGQGNACDVDDDGDGHWEGDEETKGSDPADVDSIPERCDGIDNDGDTAMDEDPAGANWDSDGDTVRDCLDASVDTDGDTQANTSDTDDDDDGFSDVIEGAISTDSLADCPTNGSHDAWPPDRNIDTQANVGDVIQTFSGIILDPARYNARSDGDAGGSVNVGDVIILFGGGVILTDCGP